MFAASSLKTARDEIAAGWSDDRVVLSYAGSGALARQITQGAPADVFISANVAWMDALEAGGQVQPETRVTLAGNRLVLIGGAAAAPVVLGPDLDLGDGRLAMALVAAVPAGIYGKAALTSLGLWERVAGQVVQADSVRAALALVASGAVPYGVVYATDAQAEPRVRVLGTFPEDSHPPILYPAALTARAQSGAFLDYLTSDAAWAVFAAQGFVRVAP